MIIAVPHSPISANYISVPIPFVSTSMLLCQIGFVDINPGVLHFYPCATSQIVISNSRTSMYC